MTQGGFYPAGRLPRSLSATDRQCESPVSIGKINRSADVPSLIVWLEIRAVVYQSTLGRMIKTAQCACVYENNIARMNEAATQSDAFQIRHEPFRDVYLSGNAT